MLVTAYYDIYNKAENLEYYTSLFYDIGCSGIPIILFIDGSSASHFQYVPSNVHIIELSLEDCELYQIAMAYKGELPPIRTPQKDTQEFLALMNTKIEFLKRAAELYPMESTFMWIDFGIAKIFRNIERVLNKLRRIQQVPFTKITIPGCWAYGHPFTVDCINWRFCGGFIIIPKEHIDRFYMHNKNVLIDFCKQSYYKLTWETNIWTIVEFCAERDNIEWYFADHNDSIILNIDNTSAMLQHSNL